MKISRILERDDDIVNVGGYLRQVVLYHLQMEYPLLLFVLAFAQVDH